MRSWQRASASTIRVSAQRPFPGRLAGHALLIAYAGTADSAYQRITVGFAVDDASIR